jgi:type III secretion protein J
MRQAAGVLLLLLSGCGGEVLYSNLAEQEVNEMVALLYDAGISATKQATTDQHFAVLTEKQSFAEAVELLRSNGYPRNKFESLGDVFKKEGFVSSPLEERARLNYAQTQELAKTIESIDGVVLARVHLAVPKKEPLSEKAAPASASVFIKHRKSAKLKGKEAQIKALIVNSIEGLPYKNVTVALFPVDPGKKKKHRQIMAQVDAADTMQQFSIRLAIGGVVTLFGVGGWWWLRKRKAGSDRLALNLSNSREKRD